MYAREALWIGFSGAVWKPNAVKVLVGGVNAVSGLPDHRDLGDPQDYLVCPQQPWLDGFNAGDGIIRQFVAMPMGEGYAVEAGHGLPEQGGVTIVAFEPMPGRFPDVPPALLGPQRFATPRPAETHEMVVGAGGLIRQKIYRDPYTREVWDTTHRVCATVTMVNSLWFAELTGRQPPPTPIDARTYAAAGLPWFDLFDEDMPTLAPSGGAPARTIGERDRELGRQTGDEAIDVERGHITELRRPK
jgi:hypothetical protein